MAGGQTLQFQILDSVGHAIVAVDLKGRILYWNRSAEMFYGWREEEVIGRPVMEITAHKLARSEAAQMMMRIRSGAAWSGEAYLRRRDGRDFHAALIYTPLRDEAGDLIGVIGAATDITKSKEAEQALRESEEKIRALVVRLIVIREEEALRISREIHDRLGQALTGIKIDVTFLQEDLSAGGVVTAESDLQIRLASMSQAIDETLAAAKKLCAELRPAVLDELGLVAALEWQARDFEARAGVFCNLFLPAETPPISQECATAMFRIFQEILTNVARHAAATEVTVQLSTGEKLTKLQVTDNGQGFIAPEETPETDLGFLGMRERAHAVAGRLEIRSAPKRGTTVVVEMPKK